jgi:hypothetical protein
VEKYLIDSVTLVHDERDVIPYVMNSQKEHDYGPMHDFYDRQPKMEHLKPFNIHKREEDGQDRKISIYMPEKIRMITGVMDCLLNQSTYINTISAQINDVSTRNDELEMEILQLRADLEWERLPWYLKITRYIRELKKAE